MNCYCRQVEFVDIVVLNSYPGNIKRCLKGIKKKNLSTAAQLITVKDEHGEVKGLVARGG